MRSLLCTLVLMTAALSSLADYNPEVKTQGTVNTNELVVFADRSGRFIKSGGRVVTNMFSGAGTTGLVTSTTATGQYLKDDGTWDSPTGLVTSTAYGDITGSVYDSTSASNALMSIDSKATNALAIAQAAPTAASLLNVSNVVRQALNAETNRAQIAETAIAIPATNALDIAGSALQFSTSASQVTNQLQVLVDAYGGASGAGTYNYTSNNVQGPVYSKDAANFLAVNGSGWSFYNGEPALGITTYSAQYITDQFLPDFGAPGYLMAGYAVTTNTIRTLISQASWGSWGTGIDAQPTNATFNVYWSAVFHNPATLRSVKAGLGVGSVVCDIIRRPYTSALGTYTTVYTGVTTSATATNIDLNTPVAAGECVGFVVTNTVTATNFWGSLEYTLP